MTVFRLGLKIAVPVALVVAVALGVAVRLGTPLPPGVLVAVPLAAGAAAYWAAVGSAKARLDALRRLLGEATPRRGDGDELDALGRLVERRSLALQTEIAELRRLEHYRREFLGNVSHELKTPVFAIQGFAETLLDGALDDERVRRTFTEKILRNTTRLHTLTRDLTEIARIESGEMTLTVASFRLDRVVAEAMETVQPQAEARGVAVALHAPDDLPPVRGDRERIRQVVTNLLVNAVVYNREGGRVDVRCAVEPSGEAVRCVVEDTGVGIAPQHLPRLTERFYRVDRSRSREQGGTGLGLAIVKHLLAAHDTALVVESTVGEGSRFEFSLPVGEARRRG